MFKTMRTNRNVVVQRADGIGTCEIESNARDVVVRIPGSVKRASFYVCPLICV